jgi:hypothetical protein
MEIQQQVTNLELSKRMKELGFKQESSYYYTPYGLQHCPFPENREYSAFTVGELGEMLKGNRFSTYWSGRKSLGKVRIRSLMD